MLAPATMTYVTAPPIWAGARASQAATAPTRAIIEKNNPLGCGHLILAPLYALGPVASMPGAQAAKQYPPYSTATTRSSLAGWTPWPVVVHSQLRPSESESPLLQVYHVPQGLTSLSLTVEAKTVDPLGLAGHVAPHCEG